MRLSPCASIVVSLILLVVCDAKGAEAQSKVLFETEPEFSIVTFNISRAIIDPSAPSPGYIFITPSLPIVGGRSQIYDADGNLVWYEASLSDETLVRTQDFHVCDYLGETGSHLCVHEDHLTENKLRGRKIIYDNSYSPVGLSFTYPDGKGEDGPNGHEFNVVDHGEAFLQPVQPNVRMDLSPYDGYEDGYVIHACFNEISIRSGKPNFEWCFSDHYPQWKEEILSHLGNETKRPPGMDMRTWDAFHLNAIDKTAEGDYLMSLRHLDQIIKIAGNKNRHGVPAGSTLWRLGGALNEFHMENLSFAGQHDVRSISVSATEEVFSILNNDWKEGQPHVSHISSGQIIKVNNATMRAFLIHEYPSFTGSVSRAMGNFQRLENGNMFIGWGSVPEITEFLHDGTVIWHASYGNISVGKTNSYRVLKSPWRGMPKWKPKVVAKTYICSKGSHSPVTAHVSWNGATDVADWRFSVANDEHGDWATVGTFKKAGFETKAVLSHGIDGAHGKQPRHVSVEALDSGGAVLGSASIAISLSQPPNRHACAAKPGEDAAGSSSETKGHATYRGILVLFFILCLSETLDCLLQRLCIRI